MFNIRIYSCFTRKELSSLGSIENQEITKPCLVACSVLKQEIKKLIENGELDADMVFVSKYFHNDCDKLEKTLRQVLEYTLQRYDGNVVLVYGDLCLGMKGQMKKLVDDYGIVKIDALNCVDCQLGGKGKSLEADPNQEVIFFFSGMMDVFRYLERQMKEEGIPLEAMSQVFRDVNGIVALDTLGNLPQLIEEINKQDTGLEILHAKSVGCENVNQVIQEAIEKNRKLQLNC
jgi:hypothetical protein